jgi:hypothetical protein
MASIIAHAKVDPDQKKILADIANDLAKLRASFLLLTAKLDLDATVTDTNYAALTNPAALATSEK